MKSLAVTNEKSDSSRSSNAERPHAVVIGLDSIQGLQSARILARRGVPVIAISDNPEHACCRTKVCQQIVFAPTGDEELIGTLENLGPQLEQKAVLFPCEDANVWLVSRHRQRLEPWYHVLLPPHDVVEMLMDKISFYNFAQEKGLPVPRTYIIESHAALQEVVGQLTFPCILKPRDSATLQWERNTMFKAFKASNAEELLETHRQHERWADCFLVQEWIEGSDADLYSCNCYFDENSEPLVTFIARKLRQWPPETGISCLGEECRNDRVLEEALRLFRGLNYRGLGYLEMKRDVRTGEHLIVEPNIGRATGRSAIAEAAGVELLYTMYCDAIGCPLPANRTQTYQGTKWIYLRRDLQSAYYYWRRGELTLRDWWKSVRGKKAFALGDWSDMGPFFADLKHAIRVALSPVERKKRALPNVGQPPQESVEPAQGSTGVPIQVR